jgi:hypothetical protein
MKPRIRLALPIVGAAIVGVLVAGSYGGWGTMNDDYGSMSGDSQSMMVKPAIKAAAETLSRLSTEVTVPTAYSEGPGWVVIHESGKNGPGAFVGYAPLKSGENKNILVTLNRPARDGESFYAMLHVDKGKIGVFEDPGADVPVLDSRAQIIMEPFKVTVPSGTPAVRLTITESSANACTVSRVEPASYANVIGSEKQHPTLTLRSGWRYEVDDPGTAAQRQFQLLEQGKNGSSDVVLLSETGTGALQSDPSVDWSAQKGAVRFTLSSDLSRELSAYRCGVAPSEAPGAIKIM